MNSSMPVLITGAYGMLGSSIAKKSALKDWRILAPRRSELDLADFESTSKYLAENKVGSIIHCAAKVGGIQANIDFPADFIMENIRIDNSILSAAREMAVENFLYFGSSCMYPRENRQPMFEEDILTGELEPTNEGYALAKITAAKTIQSVASQDNLNWKVLIPSNLYGPNDNFDKESSHLIPGVIRKVIEAVEENKKVIEIWGDGLARREFTYVDDVADFVIENFQNANNWESMMNIGLGIDYSINEYYELVGNLVGYKGKFENDFTKPSGMLQKLMDSSKARSIGWKPKIDIRSGIERTIEWYKMNH